MKVRLFFVLTLFVFLVTQAQNGASSCSDAEPMCSDTMGVKIFENVINAPDLGTRSIGCLGSAPNPAWFFIRVKDSGDLKFRIIQSTAFDTNGNTVGFGLDVDFVAWGPFTTSDSNCNVLQEACPGTGTRCPDNTMEPDYYINNLDGTNIVDCSYDRAATESFTVNNAQAGEFYILLITNFSGISGQIKLEQTNFGETGAGSTDCSIISGELGADQIVCEGTSIELDGTPERGIATAYEWQINTGTGFSAIPGETAATLNINNDKSGTYRVIITDNFGATIMDDVEITFLPVPSATPVPDISFCDLDGDGLNSFNLEADITPQILGFQDPRQFEVLYYTNQSDADNNTVANAITGSYTNSAPFTSQDIFVRIHNRSAPDACYDITQFSITVIRSPNTTQPVDYQECDDVANGGNTDGFFNSFILSSKDSEILGSLPATEFSVSYHTSLAGAQTGTGGIIDKNIPYRNTVAREQTIYVRVENISNPACVMISDPGSSGFQPFKLFVNEAPVLNNSLGDLAQCGSNNVDLTVKENEILSGQSPSDFIITYYRDSGYTNQITTPDNYTTSSSNEVIYIRKTSTVISSCFIESSFNVLTSDLFTPVQPVDYQECDDVANGGNTDGFFNSFILSSKDSEILGSLPATEFSVTYHTSLAGAQTGTGGIIDKNIPYRNTVAREQTIYVRVENISNPACVVISDPGSSGFQPFKLLVNEAPVLNNSLGDLAQCGSNNVDLTVKENEILSGQSPSDFIITYYRDSGYTNQITTPDNYTTSSSNEVIYIRKTSTVISSCFIESSFNVLTADLFTPVQPVDYQECDDVTNGGNTDGFFNSFILSSKDSEILGSLPATEFSVTYHTSLAGAQTGTGGIIDKNIPYRNTVAREQTIYVRVENISNPACVMISDPGSSDFQPFKLFVNEAPVLNNSLGDLAQCGSNNVDLTVKENEILSGQSPSDFIITYYRDFGYTNQITTPDNYTTSSSNEIIYIRKTNTVISSCFIESSFNVLTADLFTPVQPVDYRECDDVANGGNTDGFFNSFILSSKDSEILGSLPATEFSVTYHTSLAGAQTGTGGTIDKNIPYRNTVAREQTIYVRVENISNPACIVISDLGSSGFQPFKLLVNGAPVLDRRDITVIDDSDNNSIRITTTSNNLGRGDYEFALQDENLRWVRDFQDEPFFENLRGGIYTILIRDKNNCGISQIDVSVLEFPDFFTPNNDGINDTWTIKGGNSVFYPESSITIFDRFGKIIASLEIDSEGWNGLYNGRKMPSNDYWFTFELTDINGNTYTRRGHFSLLRK